MTFTYNKFKNIEDIKSRGEFFKKGKIIPSRILKCSKRKKQHCVKTNSNHWAIPTVSGYLVFVENNDGDFESIAIISHVNNCEFKCSPYNLGGTYWQGNNNTSEKDFIKIFNDRYKLMNNREYKND